MAIDQPREEKVLSASDLVIHIVSLWIVSCHWGNIWGSNLPCSTTCWDVYIFGYIWLCLADEVHRRCSRSKANRNPNISTLMNHNDLYSYAKCIAVCLGMSIELCPSCRHPIGWFTALSFDRQTKTHRSIADLDTTNVSLHPSGEFHEVHPLGSILIKLVIK